MLAGDNSVLEKIDVYKYVDKLMFKMFSIRADQGVNRALDRPQNNNININININTNKTTIKDKGDPPIPPPVSVMWALTNASRKPY